MEQLEKIINAEQTITILQISDGKRLYPFASSEVIEEPGTPEFVGDEEGYCTINVLSSDGQFMLTRYIDKEYLFAEVNAWQKYFLTVIIAVLLAGGVLILVLTTYNDRPIRKLQRDWRKKIPDMPENVIATIDKEIGKISCELTKVQNAEFGFLGDDKRYESLFAFVKQMLKNLISDAKKRDIDILYDEQTLMTQLENDKSVFESIKNASLVHWDMWEGNVFVKDGHVSGIIDWERALWGEPFMDDGFRMHNRREHFLEGFGQTSFSEDELKRLRWYDIILYLTMMIEVFYREFDDKGQYFWAREMLTKTFE